MKRFCFNVFTFAVIFLWFLFDYRAPVSWVFNFSWTIDVFSSFTYLIRSPAFLSALAVLFTFSYAPQLTKSDYPHPLLLALVGAIQFTGGALTYVFLGLLLFYESDISQVYEYAFMGLLGFTLGIGFHVLTTMLPKAKDVSPKLMSVMRTIFLVIYLPIIIPWQLAIHRSIPSKVLEQQALTFFDDAYRYAKLGVENCEAFTNKYGEITYLEPSKNPDGYRYKNSSEIHFDIRTKTDKGEVFMRVDLDQLQRDVTVLSLNFGQEKRDHTDCGISFSSLNLNDFE